MNIEANLKERVIGSALWAAAGDALGWISELTDQRGLKRRTRGKPLVRPIAWRRKIGGMAGPEVELPAGTYSDDTQLRLAVCRSIGGDGTFDVEVFAKIELTVWLAFALGAGRGTKAAAANLQKRDVNWFSNFFGSPKGPSYVQAGGNGAAMRIQPHVWRSVVAGRGFVGDVVRDAIVTHGHLYGICGAVFHAGCLEFALSNCRAPGPDEWKALIGRLSDVAETIATDDQLRRFWLGAWEASSGASLGGALEYVRKEMLQDAELLSNVSREGKASYVKAVDALQGFGERQGTGTNTALAAAYAAWLLEDKGVEAALVDVVSVLGSDTDTIGTMVGAILGATTAKLPHWEIQDRDYIIQEAARIADIGSGRRVSSFPYPDLASWIPPASLTDVLGTTSEGLAISGLGRASLLSEAGSSGSFSWSWIKLDFGQTVLCKRRKSELPEINEGQLSLLEGNKISPDHSSVRPERMISGGSNGAVDARVDLVSAESVSVDELSDIAISSGFDPVVLGECLQRCLQSPAGVDRAIAFSAIVAKAYVARQRSAARKRAKGDGGN